MALVYLRFVTDKLDEDSGRRQGLFQLISDLEHAHTLAPHEQNQYDQLDVWFRKHLRKPASFTRSSKPHAKKVALSWYKDSAVEQIKKCENFAQLLKLMTCEWLSCKRVDQGLLFMKMPFKWSRNRFKTHLPKSATMY